MKIKNGFILKEMSKDSGIFVVVAVGEASKKLNGYINLNESGALIFKTLQNGATLDGVVDAILNEYEIDRETAQKDAIMVIDNLKKIGAIDDWYILWRIIKYKRLYNKRF